MILLGTDSFFEKIDFFLVWGFSRFLVSTPPNT
jgi:hypothetical protein